MFEDGWEGYDGAEPPPPEPQPWESPDFAAWIDELAAADPGRSPTVVELLALAGGCDPVQSLLGGLDPDRLGDGDKVSVVAAAQRQENHYAGVKLAGIGAFAGAEPADHRCEEAFAWCEISAALHLGKARRGG